MITLQFEWSWFSFIIGAVSGILFMFAVVFGIAFRQWKKQKKAVAAQSDAFESMVRNWGETK